MTDSETEKIEIQAEPGESSKSSRRNRVGRKSTGGKGSTQVPGGSKEEPDEEEEENLVPQIPGTKPSVMPQSLQLRAIQHLTHLDLPAEHPSIEEGSMNTVGQMGKPQMGSSSSNAPPGNAPPRQTASRLVKGVEEEEEGVDILAHVSGVQKTKFHGDEDAELKVAIRLVGEKLYPTTLGYQGFAYLRRPDQEEFEWIGKLYGWRISRPTAYLPYVDPDLWRQHWVKGRRDHSRYEDMRENITGALRAIYEENGNVQKRVKQDWRRPLANDGTGYELMYIPELQIFEKHDDDPTIRVSHILFILIPVIIFLRYHCIA